MGKLKVLVIHIYKVIHSDIRRRRFKLVAIYNHKFFYSSTNSFIEYGLIMTNYLCM